MAHVIWLIKRLRAMSILEVLWRLTQKIIQNQEKKKFKKRKVEVTETVFNTKLSSLQISIEKLHINFENTNYTLNKSIHLLAGAEYEKYKRKWNAGFQTENIWPDIFSYDLEYKQRDDIGDARTNWELNRHFQFTLLAKNYAASRDEKYLAEFMKLFVDWNQKNPFLYGISWTSVMEVAIRCSNWCYTYAFLEHGKVSDILLDQLRNGILNMTDYVSKHYSRYSSANNHLIVEAFSIGQSGIIFNHKEWIRLSINILSKELFLQNYSDGVNKELSLHYQSFYMEAMGLMMRLLMKNNMEIPSDWKTMLKKMSQYISDCMGDYGEVVIFGDDDEGKILDLQGGEFSHYQYVLGMMSILLNQKYINNFKFETLKWLFTDSEIKKAVNRKTYISPQYCCYKEGGNSILRSKDRKILIGVDHAELGFGSIAAHGHADALSFQLFYEGHPVFIDPGTYIYHCDLFSRNEFRRTCNHNTVCIGKKDQSEMLGAFLWGRKAKSFLNEFFKEENKIRLVMTTDGYKPHIHKRILEFDGIRKIVISDEIIPGTIGEASFILGNLYHIENQDIKNSDGEIIATIEFGTSECISSDFAYSIKYGIKKITNGIKIRFYAQNKVVINFKGYSGGKG